LTLLGYYLLPGRLKNYWLLFTSLIFFAWGGVSLTALLLLSIVLNYFFGLFIERNLDSKKSYYWLVIGVSSNILILGI
jgi:alginate O-acetyltransferase complex protein AlgI